MLKSPLPFRLRPAVLRAASSLFLLGATTAALSQATSATSAAPSRVLSPRALRPSDLYRLPTVSDPHELRPYHR